MSKNSRFSDWSQEELIEYIQNLEKRKKFGLVWEETREPEEVVRLCKEKLPVLVQDTSKSIIGEEEQPTHILIEGDNYHALSVMNYTHPNSIDVIFIDPPYNTGARDWKYNNNYVDEADSYRHSKWLSFMKSRLELAKGLLKPDGIICVTVDDNEVHRLWNVMDDIFDERNHLGTIVIRNNPGGRKSKRKIALQHEYGLLFAKNSTTEVAKIEISPEEKSHTYLQDENGEWYEGRNLRKEGADSLATPDSERYYPIYRDPKSEKISSTIEYEQVIWPIDTKRVKRIWRRGKDDIDALTEEGEVYYKETRFGPQIYFRFRGGIEGETPKSIWDDPKYSASEHGTQILDEILGEREKFPFPKSPYTVMDCIKVCSDNKDAIILDFFAGSGTTLQSVLELNKQDSGNRQTILVTNNENNICEEVTLVRCRKVIEGFTRSNGNSIEVIPGNSLRYFSTGFVPAEPTDRNKVILTMQSVEMLCLRENTFDSYYESNTIKIFKNSENYTAILLDELEIPELKEHLNDIDGPVNAYIFSLGDDSFTEEFEEFGSRVKICSIPAAILNVYKRIFK